MNLFLIPLFVTLAAVVLLIVTSGIGLCLQLNPQWRPAGKSLVRNGCRALLTGIVCAWLGVPVALAVWGVAGEPAGILCLWACGPVGVLVGLLWPRRIPNRGADER